MNNHIHTPVSIDGDSGCMLSVFVNSNDIKIELWAREVMLDYESNHTKELLKLFEDYIEKHNVYKDGEA